MSQMAQTVARTESAVWAAAKRVYRFLKDERFDHQELSQGLYEISRANVEGENPDYPGVALGPVNFEKPYTTAMEGVRTVYKSTPPQLQWRKPA